MVAHQTARQAAHQAGPMPPDPLVRRYLEHLRFEKNLAARTLALYGGDLRHLQGLAHAQGLALEAVQMHHVRAWVVQMHSQGRSNADVTRRLSGWRGFYGWLGQRGLISANPVQGVRAPRTGRPAPKALGVDEAMGLASYREPEAPAWAEARDVALVELLYGSGLRVGEVVGLDLAHSAAAYRAGRGWIDWQEGQVQVQGKGAKRRSAPLTGPAVRALQQWLALRSQALPGQAQQEMALFVNTRGQRMTAADIWHRLRQRAQRAGLPVPVHPHMLRHSFASHLLQSSGDLRGVQELLGHASITSTQTYLRLDFQHLAQAYDLTHPRARKKD